MNKVTSIRNFWSLNTDEAVVTGILRSNLNKEVEVFMPLNSQMKDVDLALISSRDRNKTITIQVKGSKAYKPKKEDINKFGEGSGTWISVKKEAIKTSNADYFVFLLYVIEQFDESGDGRLYVEPHTVIIPTKKLIKKLDKYKNPPGLDKYQFYFWVNPKKLEVFDRRDLKNKDVYGYYNDFLNKKGLEILNKHFK